MSHPYFNLGKKTALITGAASGIGLAIARVFAQAGAAVCIADINQDAAEAASKQLNDEGLNAHAYACDVTSVDSTKATVEQVLHDHNKIDLLVNNAGVGFVGNLSDTPEADYDRIMNVNAKGVYLMTQAVLPHMLEQGSGNIINMASIASMIGVKDRFAYCASKGAVLMMTKSIALDYVEQGIRCNCICPTRIHTPFVDDYLSKNYPGQEREIFEKLSQYQPIGRMGKPEEVAYMALYLASDESALVTGTTFPIDGGKMMG